MDDGCTYTVNNPISIRQIKLIGVEDYVFFNFTVGVFRGLPAAILL